jgi:hypothetical protein
VKTVSVDVMPNGKSSALAAARKFFAASVDVS